jgi:hypothetical protein
MLLSRHLHFFAWTTLLFTCAAEAKRIASRRDSRSMQEDEVAPITNFELIDAATDTKIADISNGATITVPANSYSFNVNAVVESGKQIGSMSFDMDGMHSNVENFAPYALCGNSGPDFFACRKLGLGPHALVAVPWEGRNKHGKSGAPVAINFVLLAGQVTDAPTSAPSDFPSNFVSDYPSAFPSDSPSDFVSDSPSAFPSDSPSDFVSDSPSDFPSDAPGGTLLF